MVMNISKLNCRDQIEQSMQSFKEHSAVFIPKNQCHTGSVSRGLAWQAMSASSQQFESSIGCGCKCTFSQKGCLVDAVQFSTRVNKMPDIVPKCTTKSD